MIVREFAEKIGRLLDSRPTEEVIDLITARDDDVKITATREECFLWLQGIKGNLPLEHRVSVVLAEREREVRLQEAEWWEENGGDDNEIKWKERIAELRTPIEGGK
jgi:hypothetical protein